MNLDNYMKLYNYLNTLTIPDELSKKKQKWLLAESKKYFIQNNKLYKRNRQDVDHLLLVIKSIEVELVLYNNHSDIISGYFGIETTYNWIMRNYYWSQMYKDIDA